MSELAQLKSQLRSLVVSSPTAVDARTLLRDYRNLVGEALPAARHGYRDPLLFLRERCNDCFVFQGPPMNPVLTLIVPDQLKHIDEFVQRQRMPSTKHVKIKRRSIPESYARPPQDNLIVKTFRPVQRNPIIEELHCPAPKPVVQNINHNVVDHNIVREKTEQYQKSIDSGLHLLKTERVKAEQNKENHNNADSTQKPKKTVGEETDKAKESVDGTLYSRKVLQRFLQRRTPLHEAQSLECAPSRESLTDDDSGRQTFSSTSSSKQAALERLKSDITELVAARGAGVWASSLMRLYEERFGRELNYSRFGFASIAALACALDTLTAAREPDGDWLLRVRAPGAAPAPAPPALRLRRLAARAAPATTQPVDPDDALPGIDYDPDVFPPDCLSFVDSIPAASVADVAPGDMIELVVGEVYSPSHLWVLRLGPDYDRMEDIMDEMTEYFSRGAGAERVLAAGARRPGQYCSSVFEGDWHRSLVVQLVDADTVKVRHVDYGTVDTVPARALRPLRREWGALPAQAVRARLAGLRPPAAGRRWPRAAAAHCLRLVRERRLVGNVVAVDPEESIVELFLIDTSTAEDVNVSEELVRAGHADPHRLPALGAAESYLFPRFAALEAGATPNYAEIHALLRDGIVLDYVPAYRDHVPSLLPPDPPRGSAPLPPDPPHGARVSALLPPDPPRGPDASRVSASLPPNPPHGARVSALLPPDQPHGPDASRVSASLPPDPPHVPNVPSVTHGRDPPRSVALASRAIREDAVPPAPSPAPPVVNRVPLPWGPSLREPARPDRRCHSEPESDTETDGAATSATNAVSVESVSTPAPESVPVSERATSPPIPKPVISTPVFHFGTKAPIPGATLEPRAESAQKHAPAPAPTAATQPPVQTYAARPPPPRPMPAPAPGQFPLPAARPAHPAAFYAAPQMCYKPSYACPRPAYMAHPAYAQYVPLPQYGPLCCPPAARPPPPARPPPARDVRLSAGECEVFELLSLVDKNAAHRYMAEALRRAQAGPGPAPPGPGPGPGPAPPARLNPLAAEFRVAAGTQTELGPPPGFEHVSSVAFRWPQT